MFCITENNGVDWEGGGNVSIKAIALDFDGLIVDTETASYDSFCELVRGFDLDMPLEVWKEWVGGIQTWQLACDYLDAQLGKPVDREGLHRRHREMYTALIEELDVMPGVKQLLEDARRIGLRVALASSASAAWAVEHIKRCGLVDYFDVLQTRDDAAKVKPDPEIYRKAVEKLGVKPEETIAFEDSLVGTLAAKAAGLSCVAVPNRVTGLFSFEHVDLQPASLADMSLEEIIRTLEQSRTAAQG
jgi:putative hydrolase of the HAD superfamily